MINLVLLQVCLVKSILKIEYKTIFCVKLQDSVMETFKLTQAYEDPVLPWV